MDLRHMTLDEIQTRLYGLGFCVTLAQARAIRIASSHNTLIITHTEIKYESTLSRY